MSTNSIKEIVDAEIEGRVKQYSWYKYVPVTYLSGSYVDLSSVSGQPISKYWFDSTPLISKQIDSSDGGIYIGDNVSPMTKYIREATVVTDMSTTGILQYMDYLLYYPSIDETNTSEQFLTNNVSLPRYTDGVGVQIMAVSLTSRTTGRDFFVTYTNSDGVSGRISQTVTGLRSDLGYILTSSRTIGTQKSGDPFIGLQDGDKGVRSIESVTMLSGDIGLFTLILVKPLFSMNIEIGYAGANARPNEKDLLLTSGILPKIEDGAFIMPIIKVASGNIFQKTFGGSLKIIYN